jgi:elongation factor Ts
MERDLNMEITAAMVKELREKTDCPMMDCKKALIENAGDIEKSVDYLRKKGMATAKAKADRTANEGVVYTIVAADHKTGILVEVNCETDFVARNDGFQAFVKDVAEHVMEAKPKYLKAEEVPAGEKAEAVCLLEQPYAKNKAIKVGDFIAEKVGSIKENLGVKRFTIYSSGLVHSYIHMGAKLGVLLEMECDAALAKNEEYIEMAKDLTMQIAAANPLCLERSDVPADLLEKEKEIYRAQMADQKKPADILEKIINGKMNKFYEERCLLEQVFVKDATIKVNQYVTDKNKKIGSPVKIKRFVRFEIGK